MVQPTRVGSTHGDVERPAKGRRSGSASVGGMVYLFAVTLALSVLGLMLRIFAALFVGAGGLLVVALGLGFTFAGGLGLLALGFAMMHLLLPLLFIAGLIWLIRRASHHPAPPVLPPPTHA